MRHAVILSHPDPASFNASVARTYAEAAQALGQQAEVRDLYAADFDPRLPASELPWSEAYAPAAAVIAEREWLATADVIALIYPFWFNAPPAMLKGYVERVFGIGLGDRSAGDGARPHLSGKRLISVSTSGAPDAWVDQTGAAERLRVAFDDHVAAVCGLAVTDHLHLGGVTPGIREDAAQAMLDQVGELVRRHFHPAAPAT